MGNIFFSSGFRFVDTSLQKEPGILWQGFYLKSGNLQNMNQTVCILLLLWRCYMKLDVPIPCYFSLSSDKNIFNERRQSKFSNDNHTQCTIVMDLEMLAAGRL